MSQVVIETHLVIRLETPEMARDYYASLEPELKHLPKGRSSTTFTPPESNTIEFTITANDFTAARIAYNSIIQYLNVVAETWKLTQNLLHDEESGL